MTRGLAEQTPAADALQPPRRCGFRAQLRPGVDMTSDVKGWEQLFTSASNGIKIVIKGFVYWH